MEQTQAAQKADTTTTGSAKEAYTIYIQLNRLVSGITLATTKAPFSRTSTGSSFSDAFTIHRKAIFLSSLLASGSRRRQFFFWLPLLSLRERRREEKKEFL